MNQKRPEIPDENRDVCLKEEKEKTYSKAYAYLMNCAAPLLTVIFIAMSVCWAAEIQYRDKEEFDSNPEAAAVLSPDGIVPQPAVHIEPGLPEENIISVVSENTGAELVEACGIYVDNEFVGAVVNADQIEDELDLVLKDYKDDDSVIEVDYAVETEMKQGVYRSAALVSEEVMTDYLTGEKEIVKEYTANDGDTPEKLADDFGMTVEEVKELNPEMKQLKKGKLEKGKHVMVKEKVSVLPVKYTCSVTEEETLDYEVIMENSGNYLSGDEAVMETGEIGKRINQYEVTYIDGNEISRKLKKSETILEPVEETDDYDEGLYSESIPDTEEVYYASGSFIWPVNGGYVSDPFMSDRNHKGMDIAADGGTDIYASDSGTVIEAGWNDGGYGNFVVIDHENGYITLYGHASEVYVESGQRVSAGDVIAAVGTTGDSTGNHCHFEVICNGNYLNPSLFIGG